MALPTTPSAFSVVYNSEWFTNVVTATAGATDHDGFRCYVWTTSGIYQIFEVAKGDLISPNAITSDDSFTYGSNTDTSKTYWFCAYNADGESAYLYVNLPGGSAASPPAIPSALSVSWDSGFGGMIYVNSTSGDSTHLGYRFEQYSSSTWGNTYNLITTATTVSNQIFVNGVAGDVDRPYRVRTMNYAGYSDWLTINEFASTVPDQPTAFTITWTGTQIQYAATAASTDHLGFRVEKKTGATWTVVNTTVSSSQTISGVVLSGSEADSYKTYRLYTYNAIGDSVYRQVKNQSVISNLSVARNNPNDLRKVTLSWDGIISDENTWNVTHNDRQGYGAIWTLGTTTANTITVDVSIWFNFTLYVKASDSDSNTVSYAISAAYGSVDFDEPITLSTLVADQSPTPHRVRLVYSVYGGWLKYVLDSGALTSTDDIISEYTLTLSKSGQTDIVTSHSLTEVDDDEYHVVGELSDPVMGNDGWKGVWSIDVGAPISQTSATPLSNVIGDPILPNLISCSVISAIKEGEMVFNYTPAPKHRLNLITIGWEWENYLFQSDLQVEASIDGEWRVMFELPAYTYEDRNIDDMTVYRTAYVGGDPINGYISDYEPGGLEIAFNSKYFDGHQNAAYTDFVMPTENNTIPAVSELFHDVQFRAKMVGSSSYRYSSTVEQIGLWSGLHPVMLRNEGEFAVFSDPSLPNYGNLEHELQIIDYFDRQEFLVSCDGDDDVLYQELVQLTKERMVYTHTPEGNLVGRIIFNLGGVYLRTLNERNGITRDNWRVLVADQQTKQALDIAVNNDEHGWYFGNIYDAFLDGVDASYNPAQFIQRKYLDGQSHTLTHKIKWYDSNNNVITTFDFPGYSVVLPDLSSRVDGHSGKKHLVVGNENHLVDLSYPTQDNFPIDYLDNGFVAVERAFSSIIPNYSYRIANNSIPITHYDEHQSYFFTEIMENSYDSLSVVSRIYDETTGEVDEIITRYPSGGLGSVYRAGILNHLLRGVSLTKPTTLHCGLMTSSGDEVSVSGTGYTRVSISVGDTYWERINAFTSTVCNINPVVFGMPSVDWENISGWALFVGANLLVRGQFYKTKTVYAGRTNPVFAAKLLQIVVA